MPGFDGRHARVYMVSEAPCPLVGTRHFSMAVTYHRAVRGKRRQITPSPKLRTR